MAPPCILCMSVFWVRLLDLSTHCVYEYSFVGVSSKALGLYRFSGGFYFRKKNFKWDFRIRSFEILMNLNFFVIRLWKCDGNVFNFRFFRAKQSSTYLKYNLILSFLMKIWQDNRWIFKIWPPKEWQNP